MLQSSGKLPSLLSFASPGFLPEKPRFKPWQLAACSQVEAGAESERRGTSGMKAGLVISHRCCGTLLQKLAVAVNELSVKREALRKGIFWV